MGRIEGKYDQVNGILQVVNTIEISEKVEADKKTAEKEETSTSKTEEASNSIMSTSILELKQDSSGNAKSNDDRVLNGLSRMIGKWTVAQENLQNTLIFDMLNSV